MATGSISDVWNYFKDTYANMKEFKADWDRLDDQSKDDLKSGIKNGTLTY